MIKPLKSDAKYGDGLYIWNIHSETAIRSDNREINAISTPVCSDKADRKTNALTNKKA